MSNVTIKNNRITNVARLSSAANSTNPTVVKAAPGFLFKVNCYNNTAALKYIRFYDTDSIPVVGTTPIVLTLAAKPSGETDVNFPPSGLFFSEGIAYSITNSYADTDTTAVALASVLGLNVYYS